MELLRLLRRCLLLLICNMGVICCVQANPVDTLFKDYNGINKPNLVSSHPLGLLLYRINHFFQMTPVSKTTLQLDMGSANVWLPEVRGYLPNDPAAVDYLSHFDWHQRDSVFQSMPRNYDSMVMKVDGVIKTFQIKAAFRLNNRLELNLGLRSFLLTTGSDPTTILTGDAMIEGFHHYIAGGNDPFARKHYGYNHAYMEYSAPNGNSIHYQNGNFVIAGVSADLVYYPNYTFLQSHHISVNAGLHLGLNTTAYNRGMDVGLSMGIIKEIQINAIRSLNVAMAASCIRQRMLNLAATSDFIHSKYLPAFEAMIAYRKFLKQKRFWEMGVDFYCLGPYNPAAELDRITAVGNRISSHWHYALTHLYRNSQNWSFTFTYGSKWIWMCYINEDFKVNNAPDIQTGIGVKVPIM